MKFKRILSAILTVVMIASMASFAPVFAADSDKTVVYQKSGDWSISGEHNYLWVKNDLHMVKGNRYLIEFSVTAPTGNPSFIFDWRSGSNVSKTCQSWNYQALTGIYDDGNNDCVAIGPAQNWDATIYRNGNSIAYDYSIIWDTATSRFDVTINYTTADGTKGVIADSYQSAEAFSSGDVIKFWSNGTATVKNLTVSKYPNTGSVIYQKSGDWNISGQYNYLRMISDIGISEAGKSYLIEFGLTAPTGNPCFIFDWRSSQDVSKTCQSWNYQALTGIYDDGNNDCIAIGPAPDWDATVYRGGSAVAYDYSILWNTVTSRFDVVINYTKADGSTGFVADSYTSSEAFDPYDVFKFWSNGTATVRDFTVTEFVPQQAIYTAANGWTVNNHVERADGKLRMSDEVIYKPALEANKKYSIKYDVTGLEAPGGAQEWTYQYRLAMVAGGTTYDGYLSYRMAGLWENGQASKWVANGTDANIEVIIDMETGEYWLYAKDALAATGVVADTTDFALKMYRWGGNAPYISNVTVTELAKPVIYTAANGWTVNDAKEQEDGSLLLSDAVTFKPALEAGKKYSISYDVTGLKAPGGDNEWTYQFITDISTATEEVEKVLSYRMGGRWNDIATDALVASGTDGKNEIIIDTTSGEWATYALGNVSKTGTFADVSDFTIEFYRWGGDAPSISNVVVKELDYSAANGWDTNTSLETEDGKLQMSSEVIYKPALEADKKYSIKYDVTGLEAPGGNNAWTYQYRLAMVAGGTTYDGYLNYRQEGAWENQNASAWVAGGTDGSVEVIIDMETGEYELYAKDALAAKGIVTDTSDFALKMYKWGGNAPYISNVVVTELAKNKIYNLTNGWTVNEAVETEDGKLQMNSEVIFKPALEADKKYSIKYDVTGLEAPGGAQDWTYQYRLAMVAGGTTYDGYLSYRMAGVWENGNASAWVAGGTDGTIEVIINMATGEYELYAKGALAAAGTIEDTSDFALKMYRWGGNAPYISNVEVTELAEKMDAPVLTADSIKIYANDVEQAAAKVGLDTNKVTVNFGQEMFAADMTDANIYVVDKATGTKVEGAYVYADGVFTLTYANKFVPGKTYTVTVGIVKNADENATAEIYTKDFTLLKGGVHADLVSITQGGIVVDKAATLMIGPAEVNVSYENTEGTAPVVYILVAYYNGDKLVHLDKAELVTSVNQPVADYAVPYNVPALDVTYNEVQVMAWNGLSTLSPLSSAINLP